LKYEPDLEAHYYEILSFTAQFRGLPPHNGSGSYQGIYVYICSKFAYLSIYVHLCICEFMHISVSMFELYIYIYIYIYICIYVYKEYL
jgi:hypothetical protein